MDTNLGGEEKVGRASDSGGSRRTPDPSAVGLKGDEGGHGGWASKEGKSLPSPSLQIALSWSLPCRPPTLVPYTGFPSLPIGLEVGPWEGVCMDVWMEGWMDGGAGVTDEEPLPPLAGAQFLSPIKRPWNLDNSQTSH